MKMYTYEEYQAEAFQRQEQARRQALIETANQPAPEKPSRRRFR